MQLDRLRTSLQAQPVTAQSVPPDIARDWLLPDGRARVQVRAQGAGERQCGPARIRGAGERGGPEAGGSAVTIVATSRTIVDAFREAAISALVAIAVILLVALRRVLDVALVLAPLLLSALLTVVLAVLLPLPLNFANIIALPLLLGVGVSFNIYFVMNWRAGQTAPARLGHGAGDPVLGADHRHRVRLAGAVAPSRHGEHGRRCCCSAWPARCSRAWCSFRRCSPPCRGQNPDLC